jgi:T5orf172 domain-containing protein
MPIFELRLPCRGCGKECRATITDSTRSAKIRCSACGITLLDARSITGYVYVLSHPKLRGLLKVGFTMRPVAEEVQELSWVSGLPERFVLQAAFESSTPEKHTAEVHKRLASKRVQGMEYFEVPVPFAVRVIQDVIPSGPLDDEGVPESSQPGQGETSLSPLGQWSCGLCKHEWRAATPDRCPLCQSTAIVLLAGARPSLGASTL